jgi:K+-transporting ATPase ATPase C chain
VLNLLWQEKKEARMLRQVKSALMIFILLTLITGVMYPALITGIAQIIFPFQANGSLIEVSDKVQGSVLIGQNFTSPKYFWDGPHQPAVNHTLRSILPIQPIIRFQPGTLSQKLVDDVQERAQAIQAADSQNQALIPIDLVTSSASGLDPNISPEAAYYQATRVARAREMDVRAVRNMIAQFTEERQFGILGEPRVNVLLLNLALDKIQ